MLASGKVYLRSLCPDGKTLLHLASFTKKLDVCNFLSGQGLSWYEARLGGSAATPLDIFLVYPFVRCKDIKSLYEIFNFVDTKDTSNRGHLVTHLVMSGHLKYVYLKNPLLCTKMNR
ncbi:hypothetical protein ACJQWK_00332 [Exserohilum turcicum]